MNIKHLNLVFIGIIVFVNILLFSNSLNNGLIMDDDALINRWQIAHSIKNIPALLMGNLPDNLQGSYRPLRSISYAIAYKAWGTNSIFYHLLGVLLHLSICLVIYFILVKLFKNKKHAFIGALLFSVLPIHAEAINWIAASMDLIGILFFFLSFYCFLMYFKAKDKINYLGISLFFSVLAFLGNEITYVLPIIIFLYLLSRNGYKGKDISKNILISSIYFLLVASIFIIRLIILKGSLGVGGFILLNNSYGTMLFMVKIIGKYLSLLIFPVSLAINHILSPGIETFTIQAIPQGLFSKQSIIDIELIYSLILISSFILISIIGYAKNKIIFLGSVWILIALLPQLIFHATLFSERYAYLASFGYVLILVSIYKIIEIHWQKLALIILALGLIFYSSVTYFRNFDWKSNISIWNSVIRVYPQSAISYYNLAFYYGYIGDYKNSLTSFQKLIQLRPDAKETNRNLISAFRTYGKDKVADYYEQNSNSVAKPTFSIYEDDFLSFRYPSIIKVSVNKNIVLISSDPSLKITMSKNSLLKTNSIKDYISTLPALGDSLKEQGMANIPNVEYAYVRIWENRNGEIYQFILFSSAKVVEIQVVGLNKDTKGFVDQIISSLGFK